LRRERDNKLMNVQAIMAAVAHEVRQPLAAIVTNANAGLRFIAKVPPNQSDVRATLDRIGRDGHRTIEVFEGLRALFRNDEGIQLVDINKIILDVLRSLDAEFQEHSIELNPS
jgi:signal transduction histidine kinase